MEPPATAAWLHRDARAGFEVVYFQLIDDGRLVDGCTTAVEDGRTWAVDYSVTLDGNWTTRGARVTSLSAAGRRSVVLEADGAGRWLVDGQGAPHLDGCLDVDLESSAMTNALPVRRMDLPVLARAAAPAAYVRALDLSVQRLEQRYQRTTYDGMHHCYEYAAPDFDVACGLIYDEAGLVVDYPGIAARVA